MLMLRCSNYIQLTAAAFVAERNGEEQWLPQCQMSLSATLSGLQFRPWCAIFVQMPARLQPFARFVLRHVCFMLGVRRTS